MKKKAAKPTSYVPLDETSRAILDASVESAFVIDTQGYILAANDAASKLFGQTRGEDILHASIYELLPEGSPRIRQNKIEEAVATCKPVRFEEEVEGRSLVHSIVPVLNPWGEVGRLAVNTLDLTTLRKTDEDLRREQQRQIFFMESLPGIVYHLYPDQSIRYANRYFRKYFGSPKGRSCRETLNCSDKSCASCPPMKAMKTDRAEEWDWTDDKGRTFHLQCSPMTDSAGERMIMVLGIDITARKQAEDELQKAHDRLEDRVRQRTRELEKANAELTNKSMRLVNAMKKADAATRAKSAFLANMSHEIRTPLNAVLGMSELAFRIEDQNKKNNYLKRVMEAGNALLSVINDILDFSKIEARKLTLEAIDFDVRETINAVLDINMLQASNKSLALSAHVDDDVPQALVGDPSRLRQILLNLVSNAIKFTEQGSVAIHVAMAKDQNHAGEKDEKTIEFSVSDTGIGIPESKQDSIFKSFGQADDSITRKHGGTGLGLAICRLLVELMQGQLRVTSSPNQGSTFSFTARFMEGDPAFVRRQAKESAELLVNHIPKLKVLMADDNALNRELALTLLAEQGHEAVAVENGVQALEAVKKEKFDVVLMDVQMPIMDGISATRAIRDPNSGAINPDIPIVALTAHALKGDKERFLEAGMDGYIPKPIRINDFYRTIAKTVTDKPEGVTCGSEHTTPGPCDAFDRQTALDMLGGRDELLAKMDEIFLRDVPQELEELSAYITNKDWENAKRLAHSIKGSARTIGAQRAGALAEQMEYLCLHEDAPSIAREYPSLKDEVIKAINYITDTRLGP